MIDVNGVYTPLDLNTAQGMSIAAALAAGITIESGSTEEQISNWLAQFQVDVMDTSLGQSYQLQFNPVGATIDLENPNTPRLQASESSGYIKLVNGTASPISVIVDSKFTAPNGNSYTTGNNSVVVPAMDTAYISVFSEESGILQNIPSGQTFTGDYDLTVTNPQPFTNGRDIETDTEYLNRIVYLQTNNTSQQATAAAKKELQDFYGHAEIYVNNTANSLPNPVPVPSNGYIAIVQFPSGAQAGPEEIQKALQIIANRLEFGNTNSNPTSLHPVFGGTIYTGPFPENFFVIPAQAVEFTLEATISVSFSPNIDDSEKNILAVAFAKYFAQNIVDYFGGAAGNATCIFQESGSPVPAPIETPIAILADGGFIQPFIAPTFSIEQIRALISDESFLTQFVNLQYLSCDELSVVLDPQEPGQPVVELNISGDPGTVSIVDFKTTALFTDYTGWYDRFVYIDPSLLTITINEI